MTVANADMAAAWDGAEGEDWARDWEHYDLGIRRYHVRLLETAAIARDEQVLDVGCGNGQSTRDAARAAADGAAFGVDLSTRMVARARDLARAEGITNATFERADAQVHPFEPAAYDVAVSRFGSMFFADPVAAFGNIGRALRPGGRLAMLSWQVLERNEWLMALRAALAVGRDLPAPPVGVPGPFGLADPDRITAVLTASGFERVGVESANETFVAGSDADDAFTFVSSGGVARGLLQGLDDTERQRALDALHATMAAHETGEGVQFGSAGWLITAQWPG
jgi:SAM-dependent methyltransferase